MYLMSLTFRACCLSLLVFALPACSVVKDATAFKPVKAWDRDVLAQDAMQPDANRMNQFADDKIYFSREASRGGGGFGGGGCGCN